MGKLINEILEIRKALKIKEQFLRDHNFKLEADAMMHKASIVGNIASYIEMAQDENNHQRIINELNNDYNDGYTK